MTVWAAAKILGFNWNWHKFRDTFFVKLNVPGREIYVPKSDAKTKDHLARIVRGIGHTGQLSDYFDVPDQTYKDVYVDLTEAQEKRLKEIRLEYPDPIVLLGKRHQIENGVLTGNTFTPSESFVNEKLDQILDYAIEFPKMIVFAKYTEQIRILQYEIKRTGKKVFVLSGDTKDRGALIAEANKTDEYVFIAQAQVSAGWELPNCPVMVFASRTYSYVDYAQAQGRILRANALKKNLYINLIVRGGVDEAVHKSLANKQDFSDRIYIDEAALQRSA
jgi:SNF2 family DNA or RNA helicase